MPDLVQTHKVVFHVVEDQVRVPDVPVQFSRLGHHHLFQAYDVRMVHLLQNLYLSDGCDRETLAKLLRHIDLFQSHVIVRLQTLSLVHASVCSRSNLTYNLIGFVYVRRSKQFLCLHFQYLYSSDLNLLLEYKIIS